VALKATLRPPCVPSVEAPSLAGVFATPGENRQCLGGPFGASLSSRGPAMSDGPETRASDPRRLRSSMKANSGSGGGPSWLAPQRPVAGARLRLFCLPYAGSGASVYRPWSSALPGVEVVGVQLPGREGRIREPALADIEALIEGSAQAIAPLAHDLPFALFGHSLGSLIAFEVARRLRRIPGVPSPVHLIVGARRAPHVPNRLPLVGHLPDAEMLAALEEIFGKGVPDEVAAVPELLELLVPMLRADIRASEGYEYRAEAPLTCAVTAMCGTADASALPPEVEAWGRETTGPFALAIVPGDHFFVKGSSPHVLRTVARALAGTRPDAARAGNVP
jgi:medium-chain acyl-[acyl-carrier-protein] hydrolase